MANYIYGLPGDTKESILKTFELSKELNTMGWNTYAAMALPGSRLFKIAKENGTKLPESYEGYSFHSYDCIPLPTEKLQAYEILELRDQCFVDYFTNEKYLFTVKKKFGEEAAKNILEMSKIKLKRKIIEKAYAKSI